MQRDKIREWREQYARLGTQLGFEPYGDAAMFSAVVQPVWNAPHIVQTRLSPGCLFRDKGMLGDGDDRLSLVIAQTPGLGFCHRGHELCLGAGDATIAQADAPGKCRSHTGVAVVELRMPQSEWSARGVPSGDHLMRHLRRDREGLKLLSGYIRSIRTLGISVSPEGRELVRRHVIDLALMAAVHQAPIGESQESAVVAARRAAVLRHIARNFQHPELSISTTATALRISPRYLQKLLATVGTSFTDYVTEMRLQLAIQLLADGQQRIADIALQAGFCDVSNFNRIFKARFGSTPRMMRGYAPPNTASAKLN